MAGYSSLGKRGSQADCSASLYGDVSSDKQSRSLQSKQQYEYSDNGEEEGRGRGMEEMYRERCRGKGVGLRGKIRCGGHMGEWERKGNGTDM